MQKLGKMNWCRRHLQTSLADQFNSTKHFAGMHILETFIKMQAASNNLAESKWSHESGTDFVPSQIPQCK